MGSQTLTNNQSRTYWTPMMERYFIDLLLDQVHKGNRLGHTFNKQAWTDMVPMFNAIFGSKFDKDVLKIHYTNLWKQFNDIKNLLDQRGFFWDDNRKMIVADEYAWDAYIKAHPDALSYRNKAFVNFTETRLIYAYTTADGRYSLSSHDVDFEVDIQEFNMGCGVVSVVPASNDQSKPEWTPAMNQYFIKLMLDQVKRGSKINNTFSKQAWADITSLFNSKFSSQLEKRVLRNKYKKLCKDFSEMSVLLEQNGFFWDDKRQMIAASDDVWDEYIKAHPHAVLYRSKTLPNCQELGVIFGSATSSEIYSHWCQYKDFEDDLLQLANDSGKDGKTPTVNEKSRTCSWTVPMDRCLIDLLLRQALEGNKIAHEFINEAWIEMTTTFNARFESHYDKDVLKGRYNHLRKQYKDIEILLEQSGFSYDDTREMLFAKDYIWDFYIKVNPEARLYRSKTIPSYHKLCVIFGQECFNGRADHLTRTSDLNGNVPNLAFDKDTQCHAVADPIRTAWNPSMDRYLIDIMLEEMLKGNGIGQTFNKQAWINMITLFKERFGVQNDEDILRGRHQNWAKIYNDMTNLLNQSGFHWDESLQMVTAYDNVWDAYIKERPAAKSFRTTTNPNFNDLCFIFGKSPDINLKCGSGRVNRAVKSSNGSRRGWTPSMDRYFIDAMLEQVRKGSMVNNKFKKQAWGDMVGKFNAVFGSQHDTYILERNFKKLKKLFEDIKILVSSGFVWDDTLQRITGDDALWDSYIKDHPDALSYRSRSLPSYNDLFLIYGNETSHEMHYSPTLRTDAGDIILGVNSGDEGDPSPVSNEILTRKWTKPMDRSLINLMLDQVLSGNKVGHIFSEQAWACITASFNKQYGLQFNKYVLENRYLSLMKEYNYITILLNQQGFLWDETSQQVIADENVWEAYNKEQPDIIRFRGKTMENYYDLSVIFGQPTLNHERSSYMDVEAPMNYDIFDKEVDEIFGILQSPPINIEMPYHNPKRQSANYLTSSECSRKIQKISKMQVTRPYLSNIEEENNYNSSIETIVAALETIPDLDEELFFDACELLEDEKKVETFMTMNVAVRKNWLLQKLHLAKQSS